MTPSEVGELTFEEYAAFSRFMDERRGADERRGLGG
jgi:hypothetical protein